MNRFPVKQYLGIDIGGTTAKYAYITENGEILSKSSFSTGTGLGREEFLDSLFSLADNAVKMPVAGIGICSLGIVNPETGQIIGGAQNMPFLNGMNLKELFLARYPGLPVHVSNDVKAVAICEQWVGAAKECRDFFCVTLGTGLGGAAVLNSRLIEGAHYRAGEICYMNYNNAGDYLEKYVSTKYVMEQAAEALGLDEIDGFEFFGRVRNGDSICLKILDKWLLTIARFIANIVVILDVEKVIVGGGISIEKDILIPKLQSAVNNMLPEEFRNQTPIEAALHANNAGVLGSVGPLVFSAKKQ